MALLYGRLSPDDIKRHFTHIGWYFFVPIYIGLDSEDEVDVEEAPNVSVRNGCPEWLMDAADLIFGIAVALRLKLDPDYEPLFPFRITGTILKD